MNLAAELMKAIKVIDRGKVVGTDRPWRNYSVCIRDKHLVPDPTVESSARAMMGHFEYLGPSIGRPGGRLQYSEPALLRRA
jgi:hypothetical protein